VLQAEREGIHNFSLFCNHITTAPTIKAVLDEPDLMLDGFLAPGHVAMVIGLNPFQFISRDYHKPLVITGFEPLDILQALWMLLKQLVVQTQGNAPALKAIQQVFETRDFFELRGLGSIDHSGVGMRAEYAAFDAEQKFKVKNLTITDPKDCQCGAVIKGLIKPWECQIFGKRCTPETPMGALMVSSEGACAAYYNHGYGRDAA
jgi:hydrogenase expression/formation protein HypD